LLVLALVPTWSVLAGAGWLWSERGDEIADFEQALVPVDATYELFVVASRLFRAEASLSMAARPDATAATMQQAANDRQAAIVALRSAKTRLPAIVTELVPVEPGGITGSDTDALTLLSGAISTSTTLLESQVPGRPVNSQLRVVTTLARDTAAGLVLPLVDTNDAETGYFYDALSTTVRYHDQFDRDRLALVEGLVQGAPLGMYDELEVSQVRSASWRDVVDTRSFLPVLAAVDWYSTSADPDAPLFLDATDPLSALLSDFDSLDSPAQRSEFFLALQAISDDVEADVDIAYRALRANADETLTGLAQERLITSWVSSVMAVLGLALASLTISEVRRRRRVESAHSNALQQLGEKADRDPTTGVWNRRRLESSVSRMFDESPGSDHTIVLAYLDLDHFKAINDVWGHGTGDFVLRRVTEQLFGFSYGDIAFELCRFGGDEFVLFAQTRPQTLEWLEGLGEAIITAVGSEMDFNGRRHEVGVSVGIATSTGESTLDSLLLEADSSLILAKQERGTAVVYDRDVSRTGELVHALPAALASGEIVTHIQPVVDVASGEVIHVEALARWFRSSGEAVSPAVFIPLVESYGLAEKLTETVLGCVQQLISDPATPRSVRVWVNVSPRELDVANFSERFVAMLRHLDVSPHQIGVEITETAAVRDPVRLAVELRRLREVGICVAIDDFGSGYSPLGYLRDLPVDTVKIDRSLIAYIDDDIANQHIVIGIVGLVHELGMKIVAEGVERPEEQQWLVAHGVSRVQGFLFDKPMCPSQFSWHNRSDAVAASNDRAVVG